MDFILLHSVTNIRFGNCPTNVLVTEQPQYSVAICIFPTWQNTETLLISNYLRLNFSSSYFFALPITFHLARHTFATTITLANGVPIESVSKMLGHTDIRTTQIYAKVIDTKLSNDMDLLAQKINTQKVAAI